MSVVADTVPDLRPVRPERPPRQRLTPTGRRTTAGLLLGTAALYLWGLPSAGWPDPYRAGAVRGMAQDWTAFLFGATDAGGIVTAEVPPASLWVMALSARVIGFSPWSVLLTQALLGIAAVLLLAAAVRRVAGSGAGLLAGAALALTPVAVTTFRDTGPDAVLVLLLVAAGYATVRALESARTGWLLLAAALGGSAFLADPAQALAPLPALAFAYLVAGPTAAWRRLLQLLAAGVVTVAAGGWWYALVELRPPATRPYIGGSRTDSVLELLRGDDGLGPFLRVPGALPLPGWHSGVLVGWLLPAALALLVVGLLLRSRAPRTDAARGSLLLWGGWTLLTAVALAVSGEHADGTVALAPGVAALVGIGSAVLWERRRRWAGRGTLALLVAGTVAWAWTLFDRTPEVLPRWAVVAAAGTVIGIVLAGAALRRRGAAAVGVTLALMALAGPAVHAVHAAVAGGGPAAAPAANAAPAPELTDLLRATGRPWSAAAVGAQDAAALSLASDTTVLGIGGRDGRDPVPTLEEFQALVDAGDVRWFVDRAPDDGSAIPTWVRQHFEAVAIGDHTVYDLAKPKP